MSPHTRIPTEQDFASLSPSLTLSLHFPNPRESTTVILLLFHGLGDSERSFASFARSLSLPNVLAVSVRGTNSLPPALFGEEGLPLHFHWGDDVTLDPGSDGLESDPGFAAAAKVIMTHLVYETLVGKCGWALDDILLFGFGQGGSFALGLASQLRVGPLVEKIGGRDLPHKKQAFKGVVSVAGPLPASMTPSTSCYREKAQTPVLVCRGCQSDAVGDDAVEMLEREFADVKVVTWNRPDDGMPRDREEVLPLMRFFAERLRSGFVRDFPPVS